MNQAKKLSQKAFEPLDQEEQKIIDSLEKVQVPVSVPSLEEKRKLYQKAAANTVKNREALSSITIRIPNKDLIQLKERAQIQGLPYQIYIKSILKKSISTQ